MQCNWVIWQYLNSNIPCDVLLLDYSRAFDKVVQSILLTMLKRSCITGSLHGWLTDFLSNRTQYVSYKDAQSRSISVTSDMVQRTVAGLQLFSVFINDLQMFAESSDLFLFANGNKLVGKAATLVDCLRVQKNLTSIEQ